MEGLRPPPRVARFEWQTAALIGFTYTVWSLLLLFAGNMHPIIWILASGLNVTLFLSVTHEVVHGHPTRSDIINKLMVLLPISWSFPYERFRDTHLEHHNTGDLTDPFDDPESWYLAQHDWLNKNGFAKLLLRFNNTLFGRMLIGPIFGLGRFYLNELSLIVGDRSQRIYLVGVWGKHLVLCGILVAVILSVGSVPIWQWLLAVYIGHSFLLIRTFLEHQAAENFSERTVIIEQNCPIAFLFLFNNLHFIHHEKPGIPWYHLPRYFRQNREAYLSANNYYLYRSYAEIFRKYFFRAKEPVKHPFLHLQS